MKKTILTGLLFSLLLPTMTKPFENSTWTMGLGITALASFVGCGWAFNKMAKNHNFAVNTEPDAIVKSEKVIKFENDARKYKKISFGAGCAGVLFAGLATKSYLNK